MTKPRLNEDAYIAELNRRLEQHPDYVPGMAFLAHPEGARGRNITGPSTTSAGFHHAYLETEEAVKRDFDVVLTYGDQQVPLK